MKHLWFLFVFFIGCGPEIPEEPQVIIINDGRPMCDGFRSEMQFPVNTFTGITESSFNEILDQTEKVYGPIFQKLGKRLVVVRKWTDPTVNAVAYQRGNDWHIEMYGGLARHPETTDMGFAAVVGHEIGHHLAGFPMYASNTWASTEGQSDYFATLKYMRKMWRGTSFEPVNQEIRDRCNSQFANGEDRQLCYRGASAGDSLGALLASLRGATRPKMSTPDPSRVSRTLESHPAPQCRFDSYLAGALCPVSEDIDLSRTNETTGACVDEHHRPYCWFKPSTQDPGDPEDPGNPDPDPQPTKPEPPRPSTREVRYNQIFYMSFDCGVNEVKCTVIAKGPGRFLTWNYGVGKALLRIWPKHHLKARGEWRFFVRRADGEESNPAIVLVR